MSQNFKHKFWLVAAQELEDVLGQEKIFQKLKPTNDKKLAHFVYATLLLCYTPLVNKLGEIYDGTFQVQKRKVIKNLLIGATNRLLDLRKKLKNIELSDFLCIDNSLIERKFVPQDIEILRPFYFPCYRKTEIQKIIDGNVKTEGGILTDHEMSSAYIIQGNVLPTGNIQLQADGNSIKDRDSACEATTLNIPEDASETSPNPHEEHSIKITYEFTHKPDQTMLVPVERTFYEKDFLKIKDIKSKDKRRSTDDEIGKKNLEKEKRNFAALKIQTFYRSFRLRKATKEQKKILCDIIIAGPPENPKYGIEEINEHRKLQERKKAIFDQEFIKACEDEKVRISKKDGPWIMEDITDHIREWFREFYNKCKEFPRYPEEFQGGTMLLLRGETITPEEFCKNSLKLSDIKNKITEGKMKRVDEYKKKEIKKKQLEKNSDKTYKFHTEDFITKDYLNLQKTVEDYKKEWENINEEINSEEKPYMKFITEEKFEEVHKELRLAADKFMRLELEVLRKALAKDKKMKYKKQMRIKKRRKILRKIKKKIKNKDLTAGRDLQSLYQELKDAGIIVNYEKHSLDEFIGDQSSSAHEEPIVFNKNTEACRDDIKNILREISIGFGPIDFPKIKSLCLAGPKYSGKKFLVNCLASELDAVIMDISPDKILQFKENMEYFFNLINKVARLVQPTIFLIRNIQKVFYKKVPNSEKDDKPQLLSKYLFKNVVKPINSVDRILVFGLAEEPWKGRAIGIKKCFSKILLMPRTNYGVVFRMLRTACMNKICVPKDFEFSPLAAIPKGINYSAICNSIEKTLDINRRMACAGPGNKIIHKEILEGLIQESLSNIPLSNEEYANYTNWYRTVNYFEKIRAQEIQEKNQKVEHKIIRK